jgi:glutamine amidotransferase
MRVGIIDLGINNLTSVQRAFSISLKPSDSLLIIEKESKIEQLDLVILPGLGKFASGMNALNSRNLVKEIKNWTNQGTRMVGICLGMQLLGKSSSESKGVEGLDLIDARIESLPHDQNEKIPHIGWGSTSVVTANLYFKSLATIGDFYFAHSYQMIPSQKQDVLTTTSFGSNNFVSSIISRNILGVQFHPEKSGAKGRTLISEIINWARDEI